VTEHGDGHPVILFDGVCTLCCGMTRWIIARDREAVFRFAPLQSEAGRRLLAAHDLPADELSTIVLIEGGDAYRRSDAAWRIAARLGGVWRLLAWLRVVPRPLRDAVYRFIARHRYRWFGRRDACMRPDACDAGRFVIDG
jgi:predicted DCC family thiol-disulfide oxidoreductase YuxK